MSVYSKQDNKGKKPIDTATPKDLCKMIHKLIKQVYTPTRILDPCCGDKRLTELFSNEGCEVINYEIKDGTDFLLENEKIDCEVVLTSTTVTTFNFNTAPTSNQYRVVIIG